MALKILFGETGDVSIRPTGNAGFEKHLWPSHSHELHVSNSSLRGLSQHPQASSTGSHEVREPYSQPSELGFLLSFFLGSSISRICSSHIDRTENSATVVPLGSALKKQS